MQKEMNKSISKMKIPSEASDFGQSRSRRQYETDPARKRESTREQAPSATRQPLRHSKTSSPGASDFSARPQSSKKRRQVGRSSAP